MAVLLETANNEYLYRTASVPAFRSCTITGWARYKTNTYRDICGLMSGTDFLGINTDDASVKAIVSGAGSVTIRGTFPAADDWMFFALTHKASTYKLQATAVIGAEAITLATFDEEYWAGSAYSGLYLGLKNTADVSGKTWGGAIADVKVWSAVLSEAEIEAEQFTKIPVKTTDLWAYYPLDVYTDLTDHGATYGAAGGRDLTASGTLSTEASDPPWASGAPYTLAATGGSFAWGVVAATLLRGFVLQAEATHPTGESYSLTVDPAAYTLTVEDSTSWVDYSIGADGDTLALTGAAAAVTKGVGFTASPGSYTLTGQTAAVGTGWHLDASGATFTETATDATLRKDQGTVFTAGSYSLTGEAAALSKVNLLAATGATITETGGVVGTNVGRLVTAEAATYTQTGEEITAEKSRSLFADVGTFRESGQSMEMIYSPETLTLDERSFMWVG